MSALLAYGAAALGVVLAVVLGAWLWAGEPARSAIVLSSAVAYCVQLAAFGALVAVRGRGSLFTVGWAAGMALRFVVLAGMTYWLSRRDSPAQAPALVSLVGVMFVLVLLEAIFLRRDMRSS